MGNTNRKEKWTQKNTQTLNRKQHRDNKHLWKVARPSGARWHSAAPARRFEAARGFYRCTPICLGYRWEGCQCWMLFFLALYYISTLVYIVLKFFFTLWYTEFSCIPLRVFWSVVVYIFVPFFCFLCISYIWENFYYVSITT